MAESPWKIKLIIELQFMYDIPIWVWSSFNKCCEACV